MEIVNFKITDELLFDLLLIEISVESVIEVDQQTFYVESLN